MMDFKRFILLAVLVMAPYSAGCSARAKDVMAAGENGFRQKRMAPDSLLYDEEPARGYSKSQRQKRETYYAFAPASGAPEPGLGYANPYYRQKREAAYAYAPASGAPEPGLGYANPYYRQKREAAYAYAPVSWHAEPGLGYVHPQYRQKREAYYAYAPVSWPAEAGLEFAAPDRYRQKRAVVPLALSYEERARGYAEPYRQKRESYSAYSPASKAAEPGYGYAESYYRQKRQAGYGYAGATEPAHAYAAPTTVEERHKRELDLGQRYGYFDQYFYAGLPVHSYPHEEIGAYRRKRNARPKPELWYGLPWHGGYGN